MSSAISNSRSTSASDNGQPLDGITILRFAHAYETGGGVELHLRDLNYGLGRRNSFTTVMVHLSKECAPGCERVDSIGESKLIKIPLQATGRGDCAIGSKLDQQPARWRRWLGWAMDRALFSFMLNLLFVRSLLWWHRIPRRAGEALSAGATTAELIRRHDVDLVVLHTNGGSDASEVIAASRKAGVPIAMIHHFSNDRLGNVSVRQQVAGVDALAGASTVDLPAYVRRRFTNLSDAVDLEFFRVENASPVSVALSAPVLFVPGRMTPEKGQMDALMVAVELHRRGIMNTLVFAGRVDDPVFEKQVRERAREAGLSDFVHFAGELTLLQYRDWFHASYLMLMPTHHHEGMPRTLIDSQAMMVPPIVYNIGGTPDGVRHDQTGFLVQLGDIPAMTEHAAALLGSPERRKRMAASGRAFVEAEFSMAAFLARHETFYLETVTRARRRRVRIRHA